MSRLVPSSSVLVIAPDVDMRRSLAFMLSAEGFAVVSDAAWPPLVAEDHADAVIIDHGAFARDFVDDGRLAAFGERLVVLSGREGRTPPLPLAVTVRKPLLDRKLLDALRHALAADT